MSFVYQLPILLYHRVVNDGCAIGRSKIYVKEKRFRKQMLWLKENGYETITFRDLQYISPETDLKGKVILTFDDGYIDNYTVLFPMLREFGFKAVIFLVTGCKRNEWSIKEGEPSIDLLTVDQIREMDGYGVEFGGHTQHHVDLKLASTDVQREEIAGCFKDLEHCLRKKPVSFSYPYGVYNEDTLKLLQGSGFSYGISTIFGAREWRQDLLRIRRIEVTPKTKMMSFRRKVSGLYLQTKLLNYYMSNN